MELSPWPYNWRQLHDISYDADHYDENEVYNCGPQSWSQLIWHIAQVHVPGDSLKDSVAGDGYVGYITLTQMSAIGQTWLDITCPWHSYSTRDSWIAAIKAELGRWRGLIGLFSWAYVGNPAGHYRCITGDTGSRIITSDPMYGRMEQSYQDAWDWACGPQGNPIMTQPRKRCIAWD
jgi:hypothetical protein